MNLSGLESAISDSVVLTRAALVFEESQLAEDIMVRLRRGAKR
jgi:hypothetical protein